MPQKPWSINRGGRAVLPSQPAQGLTQCLGIHKGTREKPSCAQRVPTSGVCFLEVQALLTPHHPATARLSSSRTVPQRRSKALHAELK